MFSSEQKAENYQEQEQETILWCFITTDFGTVTTWAMHLGRKGLSTLALQYAHRTRHSEVSLSRPELSYT
jgi:hypothetical protein